jgi:hypothetical protein
MFNEKFIMFKKVDKDEKVPPAFLENKNFETGTIAFKLLFQSNESILDLVVFWSSAKENVVLAFTPTKLKITNHENGNPNTLYNGKIVMELF